MKKNVNGLSNPNHCDSDENQSSDASSTLIGLNDEELSNSTPDINIKSKSVKTAGSILSDIRNASLSILMVEQASNDRNANSFMTGWNVSNLIQGIGILGIPYAVRQGGWICIVSIYVVAFLCCHTGKILIDCMYNTSRKKTRKIRVCKNYPEIAERVMGRKGFVIISVIQNLEMLCAVGLYFVLLGTTWADMLVQVKIFGYNEWVLLSACVILPALFIKRISILSWLSMLSVFSLIASIFVLIYFCLTQISQLDVHKIPVIEIRKFPIGFGIIVFSYCAHPVLPSIEGSMKKPHQYNTMLNVTFLMAAVTKSFLGIFMVAKYGNDIHQVVTVNLRKEEFLSKFSTSFVIANVMLAAPLCMFVVSAFFDDAFLRYFPSINQHPCFKFFWLLLSRPLLLSVALVIAIYVPHFGLVMSFIGSFTGTCLSFIFPCYFHLKLRWSSLLYYQICFDTFVLVFGISSGLLGLFFSGRALLESLN